MTKEKNKKENIETLMKQIENIIDKLEAGEIDLDESIKQYENGMLMIEKCKKILKESKLKVEILKKKTKAGEEDEGRGEEEDEDEDLDEDENEDVDGDDDEKLF